MQGSHVGVQGSHVGVSTADSTTTMHQKIYRI